MIFLLFFIELYFYLYISRKTHWYIDIRTPNHALIPPNQTPFELKRVLKQCACPRYDRFDSCVDWCVEQVHMEYAKITEKVTK